MPRYDAKRIEAKWQQYWDQNDTFVTPNEAPDGSTGKMYVLDMFPYPSGAGLHVGHPEGYTATDIVVRYNRMQGKHVLHPMGWDAFGLPAEQHAINTGTHPRETTYKNIATFKRQLKMLGFSYDWSREISTTDEDYYRWTQWIFLKLFDTWYDPDFEWTGPDGTKRRGKGRPISELPVPADISAIGNEAIRRYQDAHRLAYQSEAPVNWCPALGTVLANEEVTSEGLSERGGHPVERRPLRQWMLRITSYAERLISELDGVDWPESVKLLQRNWIGRSVGAEVDFLVEERESRSEEKTSPDPASRSSILDFAGWKEQRAKSGYPVSPEANVLRIYTTRPDTLYGATYMVVAPEHPIVDRITTTQQRAAVDAYRTKSALKSDLDRTDLAKEKTGVFTGAYAINPVNGERIPIWIADYVLISYGTGAIMAVPAHDERDFEFAQKYSLPVIPVVLPPLDWLQSHRPKSFYVPEHFDADEAAVSVIATWGPVEQLPDIYFRHRAKTSGKTLESLKKSLTTFYEKLVADSHEWQQGADLAWAFRFGDYLRHESVPAFTEYGTAINSGDYDRLPTAEFKAKITADLAAAGLGREAVNYKLRDWLFSRQRYWGEPFPIWHELDSDGNPTGLMRAVPEDQLPVTLPDMDDFKPKGTPDPPLNHAPADWLYATAPDGTKLKRETNSMPQWAGSCWYYLRFCDNKNGSDFIDPAVEKYWLPVDLYIGGVEHAVLHLLYSRFWHKVLFDRGHVTTPEPFHKLVNQGMILGENNEKMSKSRGNVINPDDVVQVYGADSLRLYEMFMGPLEQVKPWSMKGVEGVFRFLGRVWRLIADDMADEIQLNAAVQDVPLDGDNERILHKTIKGVTQDIDKLAFNTAISKMMEFTNHFTGVEVRPKAAMEPFVLLLAPFAPHLAEDLWAMLGHNESLTYAPWPKWDESKLVESTVEIPVQISGKLRCKIVVPAGLDAAALEAAARSNDEVKKFVGDKTIVKAIAVAGKLVNLVVK